MKVDNQLLFKFFSKENTPSEADAIAAWLKEDKFHTEEFEKAFKLFALSQMALCGIETGETVKKKQFPRWVYTAIAAAAAIVIGIFAGHQMRPATTNPMLVSEAHWGKMLTQTLSDGTVIEMNSGSRIEYPAVFLDKERRVKLEGEAIFDVSHNEKQPFIVETFAYDIRVIGTKFDIVANQREGEFSATLLEGSIEVLDKDQNVRARLSPNQVVKMDENGKLYSADFASAKEAMAWSDGLISVAGVSFLDIMKRMEKAFGVTIVVDMPNVPEEVLPYGKIRITDGIVSAFGVLKHHYDFDYEFDVQNNLYKIK